MRTIVFLWCVVLLSVWACSAMNHFFPHGWWSFPTYMTIVICVSGVAGYFLLRERKES